MQFRSPGRVLARMSNDHLPSRFTFTASLPQPRTEAILRARAHEGGVRFVAGRARGVVEDDAGVAAVLEDGSSVRGRYLVAADGMHSTVREAIGVSYEDTGAEAFDDQNMILADVILSGPADFEYINATMGPAGLAVLAPLPGGLMRLVVNAPAQRTAPSDDELQDFLDARGPRPASIGGRLVIDSVVWTSHFQYRHRLASTFRAGRVLIAGDAGHAHSPAAGQGMNLGIRDAFYAAAAVDSALADGGSPHRSETILDTYAAHRKAAAQGVIAATNRMNRMFYAPPPAQPLRNLALRVLSRTAVPSKMALGFSGLLDTGPDVSRADAAPHAASAA
ncbi:NAD(P)/FAD-dependent oxidoreductase [Sinomonas notoginsengisoli]